MKNILGVGIFLLFHAFSSGSLWADIYRFVDEKGVIHFTNAPADNRYKLYIRSGYSPAGRYSPLGNRHLQFDHLIREMSVKYRVDSDLVRAVIKAESDFCPGAVSKKGAQGLMQLMPETACDMSVRNVFNPRENIEGGVKYLRRLLDMFNHNLPLTLAAYNAGENAVIEYNYTIPPFTETQDYVKKVLLYLRNYKNGQWRK